MSIKYGPCSISQSDKQDDFRWNTDACMHFYLNSYVEKYIISLQNKWSYGYYLLGLRKVRNVSQFEFHLKKNIQ